MECNNHNYDYDDDDDDDDFDGDADGVDNMDDKPVHNSTAKQGEAQKSWARKLENLQIVRPSSS